MRQVLNGFLQRLDVGAQDNVLLILAVVIDFRLRGVVVELIAALRGLGDRMRIGAHRLDNGIESLLGIRRIVNGANGAVGFEDTIVSFDAIAVAGLPLGLDIASMQILDAVAKGIAGMFLKRNMQKNTKS